MAAEKMRLELQSSGRGIIISTKHKECEVELSDPSKGTVLVEPTGTSLKDGWHLATVDEVSERRREVLRLIDQWGIALLADGKLEGAGYGGKVTPGDFSKEDIGERVVMLDLAQAVKAPTATMDAEEWAVRVAKESVTGVHDVECLAECTWEEVLERMLAHESQQRNTSTGIPVIRRIFSTILSQAAQMPFGENTIQWLVVRRKFLGLDPMPLDGPLTTAAQSAQLEAFLVLLSLASHSCDTLHAAACAAAQGGHLEILWKLVQIGVSLGSKAGLTESALSTESKDVLQAAMTYKLLLGGPVSTEPVGDDATDSDEVALFRAVRAAERKGVEEILAEHGEGPLIFAVTGKGWTALHFAVAGYVAYPKTRDTMREIIDLLITQGARPDTADIDGWTPAHWAAAGRESALLACLLGVADREGAERAANRPNSPVEGGDDPQPYEGLRTDLPEIHTWSNPLPYLPCTAGEVFFPIRHPLLGRRWQGTLPGKQRRMLLEVSDFADINKGELAGKIRRLW
eukprot:Sspe_Gene.76640::Locus_47888_Transcript_2_2_Confidence_0.667_Length_1584::g.76640::m.76640